MALGAAAKHLNICGTLGAARRQLANDASKGNTQAFVRLSTRRDGPNAATVQTPGRHGMWHQKRADADSVCMARTVRGCARDCVQP